MREFKRINAESPQALCLLRQLRKYKQMCARFVRMLRATLCFEFKSFLISFVLLRSKLRSETQELDQSPAICPRLLRVRLVGIGKLVKDVRNFRDASFALQLTQLFPRFETPPLWVWIMHSWWCYFEQDGRVCCARSAFEWYDLSCRAKFNFNNLPLNF